MRFEIQGENRLGITRDVVNVLTDQGLDIRAFEVTTHYIHADIPAIRPERLPELLKKIFVIVIFLLF